MPPTIEECQQQLNPKQAIIQPFIDHTQNILRVLWLDKQQLKIYDFSNADNAGHWQQLIELWQQHENWQTVLDNNIFNSFADDIQRWANDIEHIIAIFPTPLGQLAWEAMPQLANKLSREISIDHWLHCPKSQIETESWALGVTDIDDVENAAQFIPHETYLVAKHWNIQPTLVEQTEPLALFQALQNLQNHRNVFISTHGVFDSNQPLQSGLSLNNHDAEKRKNIDLPLWLCTTLRLDNTELMILSACQTASTKSNTNNLFDPISISSAFAAAGVNTVIATLSQVGSLASLLFINELLELAQQQPKTPWHQLIAQTQESFKRKTDADMKILAEEIQQTSKLTKGQKLEFTSKLTDYKNAPLVERNAPENWANFIVIGDVERD
ncbi:CHAT domain-containing protein [Candidatus Albibeggiatoa sp. nov. BB20]|uniref:CHAT domain-containing protein n=1 Tax=Candidatus Albibeggiatoa sp. nov. BB20 TaxID=3162723 RepID=UPI003365AF94